MLNQENATPQRLVLRHAPAAGTVFRSPVTLTGLSGTIPPFTVQTRSTLEQSWAVQVLDCAPRTVFESITVIGEVSETDKSDWLNAVPDGVADLSGCTFRKVDLYRVNCGFAQRAAGGVVEWIVGDLISGDLGITLADQCEVRRGQLLRAVEVFPYARQHRDVWQVAHPEGGVITAVRLAHLESSSDSHPWGNPQTLQGILFTDCVARDCCVTRCSITGGHPVHGITLGAAQGCTVTDNRTDAGIHLGWGLAPTHSNITTGNTLLREFNTMETLLKDCADHLGVEVLALRALMMQESVGNGFYQEQPTILFEPTKFTKALLDEGVDVAELLAARPSLKALIAFERVTKYGTLAEQYQKLERAMVVSETAGVAACSWGLFQIGGWQWKAMGYDSPLVFAEKAQTLEGQFELFVTYMERVKPKALQALQDRDWERLKVQYNGAAKSAWAYEIAQVYRRLLAERDPKKPLTKGASRTVNSQVVDVGLKTGGAVTLEQMSHPVEADPATVNGIASALEQVEQLKGDMAAIKDVAAQVAEQVQTVSSWTDGNTWMIVALWGILLLPNIRAVWAYLQDNGYVRQL